MTTITLILILIILSEMIHILYRLDKIVKRAKRVDSDINTLQETNLMLASNLKKVYQEFKTHEKKEKSNEKKRRIVVS